MYIIVSRTGKNKKNAYVKLMEAYRDADGKKRARTIKNYGWLDALLAEDPQALEKLKKKYSDEREAKKRAIAEERLKCVQRVLENSAEPASGPDSHIPCVTMHYGHYAVRSIWDKDLGLGPMLESLQKETHPGGQDNFSINDAALFMTSVTVMDPDTSLGGYGYTEYTGLDFLGNPLKDISLNDLYTALCFLKDSKDSILGWCKQKLEEKSGKGRSSALVLFSVPNEGLMQKPSIALLVDEKGFPADYELFSGRASEKSTLKTAIEKLKSRNKIQPAVIMADSRLNKAVCLKTLQEIDPVFYIAESGGKGSDAEGDGISTAQQTFIRQNLLLLKKSFEHCPASLPDADHIQGHILVCILAQLLLQLIRSRLEQQGTKLEPQKISSNLYGAIVTTIDLSATEVYFLLTSGRIDIGHMPEIMRACGLKPVILISTLPVLAEALGTSFASPADACPLLGPEFQA